jgi:hypothetical protein
VLKDGRETEKSRISGKNAAKRVLTDLQQDAIVDLRTLVAATGRLNKGNTMPVAYSYIRFSSKKQEQNDSVKRQTRLRDEWLRQNPEMTLDTTISLQDLGVSAFRGRNLDPEWGDLGKFIDLAERQESPIEKGSILLLERLDRFSRQRVSIAYTALVRLVHAGIKVVVLDPVAHQIDRENIDQLHVVLPIVTNLCLAHEQSREKSKRVSYAWISRREDTRAGKKIFTKRLPAWLRYNENLNRLELNNASADAVKHIFKRTADGIGQVQLVREMNEKYPPIAPQKTNSEPPKWNTSYICKILNDRSVIGEFQPHTMKEGKRRIPDGDPIKDYFPRVISDELFYQSQYQKSLRKKEKSRNESTFLNLFTGIVVNTADKFVMQIQTSRTKRKDGSVYLQRRLWSYGNRRGITGSCPWGLDYYPFEKVMLHALSELNPEEFTEPFKPTGEREKLQQLIDGIELRIRELENSILDLSSNGSATRISKLIDDLQDRKNVAIQSMDVLIGVGEASKQDIVEGLKSIATICCEDSGKATQNIRAKIKSIIPTIVERIEIALLKRSNRNVIAKGILFLRNGDVRYISVRKNAGWRSLRNIVYFDKNKRPVLLLCPYGSVIWSEFHGMSKEEVSNLSDCERKAINELRQELSWVAVDGVLQPLSELYSRLVDDYLEDEMEDFAVSSTKW